MAASGPQREGATRGSLQEKVTFKLGFEEEKDLTSGAESSQHRIWEVGKSGVQREQKRG